MPRHDEGRDYGLIAYFLVLLGAVFVGPLEAALGLAAYWLFTGEADESGSRDSGTR